VLHAEALNLIVARAEHIVAVAHPRMLGALAKRASKNLRAKGKGGQRSLQRMPDLARNGMLGDAVWELNQ
jgi:hypothetical protein